MFLQGQVWPIQNQTGRYILKILLRCVQTAKAAALQDSYPWLNLVELNDAGNIWFKYCVGNSGGGTFLVDQEGKILAICPTAEEVERILEKMLK